jgi:hypothetical protein
MYGCRLKTSSLWAIMLKKKKNGNFEDHAAFILRLKTKYSKKPT